MQEMKFAQKDKGDVINIAIQYANASPVNLTGYTVNLKSWEPGNPSVLLINGSCAIINVSNGTCNYTIQSGDFNTIGIYYGEVERMTTGVNISTETFKIIVSESG